MSTYTVTNGPFGEPAYEHAVHNVDTVTVIPQFRTVQFHDADGLLIAAFNEVQHVARVAGEEEKAATDEMLAAAKSYREMQKVLLAALRSVVGDSAEGHGSEGGS